MRRIVTGPARGGCIEPPRFGRANRQPSRVFAAAIRGAETDSPFRCFRAMPIQRNESERAGARGAGAPRKEHRPAGSRRREGTMLLLTRKLGENIRIGDDVKITIVEVKGNHVKLGIDAPASVKVHREEIYERIQQENRRNQAGAAAGSAGVKTGAGTAPAGTAAADGASKNPQRPAEAKGGASGEGSS